MRSLVIRRLSLSLFLFAGALLVLALSAPRLIAQSPGRPKSPAKADTTSKPAAPSGPTLFRDWNQPLAVIVFSGQQHGYLEPCGCSPEFQKGGLARRAGFIKSLQQKKWPLIVADLGGLLDDHSQPPVEGKFMAGEMQAQAKMETALEAMHLMRYTVLNLSPEDIEVPNGLFGLMGMLINIDNPPLPRMINTNLDPAGDFVKAGLIAPYRVEPVGGTKVAFIGTVGARHKDRMADPALGGWQPPEKILATNMRKIVQESTPGLQLLMHYGDLDEAKELAQKFPDLDVIIYGSDAEEPNSRPEFVNNNRTMLATIGSKGKYTGAIGVFRNEPRLRFELAPLDDRFDEDSAIRDLLDNTYIEKLKNLDLVAQAPRIACDTSNPDVGFVGSKKCAECHEKVYEFWLSTRHSHALETLVDGFVDAAGKKIAPGKQHNPECVSCHTTGFFNKTGYDGTDATKHLGGNGCENCHGAGSEHVRRMSNPDITPEEKREAIKLVKLRSQTEDLNVCRRCHDGENSPKFKLHEYWNQVDHSAEATEDKENWPKVLEKLREKKGAQP